MISDFLGTHPSILHHSNVTRNPSLVSHSRHGTLSSGQDREAEVKM